MPATQPLAALGDQLVIGLFATHEAADGAVRQLADAGVAWPAISIVGKNCHSEEHAVGYVRAGDRAWFFGRRGAFWGGLGGLLLGSGFFYIPFIGPLVALGPIASTLAGGLEGAVLAGGASALAGALGVMGIPRGTAVRYETALQADQFLVTVHASRQDVARIERVLVGSGGSGVQSHPLAADAGA